MKQNYINHISYTLDSSGSMAHLASDVIRIFDNQIQNLANVSKQTDQETRVSVYKFSDQTQNIIFDKDVLRLPSIKDEYKPSGNTALIDATLKTIEDLEKTNTLYGDHSFLLFIQTDGESNSDTRSSTELKNKLDKLPDHWTVAVLVPNAIAMSQCKKLGFPPGNIQIWNTDKAGIEEVGRNITKIATNYMAARSTGVRGTKTLFQLDTSKLTSQVVLDNLDQIDPKSYDLLVVRKDGQAIQEFVESWKYVYSKGSAYYQLSKSEKIQASKQILVQNKISGKVYGGAEARKLLGLPDYEVKVEPSDFKNYNLYVQSTSSNRKLVANTNLIYFK